MVSPQLWLGLALALVLGLIGGYVVWIAGRLDALEAASRKQAKIDDDEAGQLPGRQEENTG